jgi:cytochrome c2
VLDEWLTDRQAVVPWTKMIISFGDARDRADVIAFLTEKATTQPNVTAGAR